MATFVLVHGSWQGAWCWQHVVPVLEHTGHRAVTLDLPGHGADQTPVGDVTLQNYADAIAQAVASLSEPAILVGHSMGGPITAAVESAPDRVAARVYVAGLIPPNGSPMFDLVKEYDPAFLATFETAADGRSVRITREGARRFLYPHCPSEDVEIAISLLSAEPVAPFQEPVSISPERGGRVPAYYIETKRDRVVPLALQRSIQARHAFKQVFSLDTDHSPFFSALNELAHILNSIASD
jgi:pimeloyl-ACP methyl ester carboxylesterase